MSYLQHQHPVNPMSFTDSTIVQLDTYAIILCKMWPCSHDNGVSCLQVESHAACPHTEKEDGVLAIWLVELPHLQQEPASFCLHPSQTVAFGAGE